MCLTKPYKIKSIDGSSAILEDGRRVNLCTIRGAQTGDWVLVNADLAINKVSEKEAEEINSYFSK